MLASELMTKIEKIANEVAQREGCVIYDLEFIGAGKGRVLRVYIDKEGGGVGLDDCSNVSKGLNLILDVEDVIPGGAYSLEVSTPGVERHLKKPWHFKAAIGKKIFVQSKNSFETMGVTEKKWLKAKKTEAMLVDSSEDFIALDLGAGVEIKIPYAQIEKAKVVFEFGRKK